VAGVTVTAPATILILEGNPAVEEMIEQALRASGHWVLSTQNSLEALDVVRRIHVDVLVAGDLLEGRQAVVDELREIQPDLRVISICGPDDDVDDGDLCARLSMPVALHELRAAVENGLNGD
jgi:DNA-binding response OmpR family regulator